MQPVSRWTRLLGIVGLVAMLLGALDPLEGSVVILAGVIVAAISARLAHSTVQRLLLVSALLVTTGVAALFALTALGGAGGTSGRSIWWLLVVLPYPVGWVIGLVAAFRRLREDAGASTDTSRPRGAA